MSYRDLIYNEFMRSPFCNVAMLTVQVKIDCCHGSQWQPHAKILAKIRPIPLPPICQGGGGAADLISSFAMDFGRIECG